ncbi:tyrosine-type recombinase/integrase [Imhoffiella purpurea]|uniref:Phage integrase n=1 Tax=Imhoffiella purpurea TaxID=1249627 RepID=W9V8S5_9GAMM|nr:site-specific integrase [Imhoffiella purpurea]EXJ16003.1 Phage integrase [Imhoffiella purpurea]
MATIEKRTDNKGSTTYRVKVRLRGYPSQTATFDRLSKAKDWAKSTEAAIKEGRHFKSTEAKKHTLGDLVERYVRDVLPHKSESSRSHQKQQLGWWKNQIGDHLLADVTPALIAEYRDKLAQIETYRGGKTSPATVGRYLTALSHAFSVAMKEWGWVEENPLLKVSKPKEPRGRVRFLSDDERQRLLTACRESRSRDLYPAVVLALSTGARQQEILGLDWKDVDLERKVAVLHETKNGDRRVLPLSGPGLELLKKRAEERRGGDEGRPLTGLVFPGRKNKSEPVDLRTPFETALKRAGIEDFRWHDLRHSAASYLAMNGASLAEIAEVLGHKTLAMVKRYAHLSEAHTASVVERMNAAIFE